MSKDPAFLFYPKDFLMGCSDLTFEERGQFITLLCYQHQKGHLTPKMIKLLCHGNATADVLANFEQDENGDFFNARLENEIEKRRVYSDKQRARALKRWENKDNKAKKSTNKKESRGNAAAYPTAMPKIGNGNGIVIVNENEITKDAHVEIYPTFQDFWDAYDKKVDRTKCFKKWHKLNHGTKKQIIAHLMAYVPATEKRYRRNPLTYLNSEHWNSEIIQDETTQKINRQSVATIQSNLRGWTKNG